VTGQRRLAEAAPRVVLRTEVGATVTTRSIRDANRFAVLRGIYSLVTPTRKDLIGLTGLSSATISTVVSELLATGLLVESGRQESGGGRPSTRIGVASDYGLLVGVDVAETYVHADVYDAALNRLSRDERTMTGSSEPEQVIHQVVDLVRAAMASYTGRTVLGVGVSLPGQVEPRSGVSVVAPNWGWSDVPAEMLLTEQLAHRVHLDNPLKATTVAELWFGHGRMTGDLVTINLGTGVGAGIAIGGQLVRGVTNNAGEWGHTTLVLGGRRCRCGRNGCVEAYIGVSGLMAEFRARFGANHPYLVGGGQTDFVDRLVAGLEAADAEAEWMINHFARHLGAAIANVVNMINPRLVVLSSWIARRLGPWLLPATTEVMRAESIQGSAAATDLVFSAVPDSPVALGMATLALESYLESRYSRVGATQIRTR